MPHIDGLSVGLQAGRDDVIRGTEGPDELAFDVTIDVKRAADGSPDFRGPLVHGPKGERFLYVTWGRLQDGRHEMFRRLKLYLSPLERAHWSQPGLTWDDIGGGEVELRISGKGIDGTPACGTSPAPWRPVRRSRT
jgi:hypothetical protein